MPAPFRPSTAVIAPWCACQLSPASATVSPYALWMSRTSTATLGTRASLAAGDLREDGACDGCGWPRCRRHFRGEERDEDPGFDPVGQLRDNVVVKNTAAPTLADRRTRQRVAGLLLELGPSTATALSERLGLTPAAIRGTSTRCCSTARITAREAPVRGPRGRGRPARLFALSDAGPRERRSDGLRRRRGRGAALPARDRGGAGGRGVRPPADRPSGRRATPRSIASLPLADRPAALADALCADGYAATVHDGGCGVQVCQHHCPVQHVAEEFPALCEAETEAIGRLRRPPRPTTRDHRARRRCLHDAHPADTRVSYYVREGLFMTTDRPLPDLEGLGRYAFGWADSDAAGATATRGLSEAKVREI